MRRQPQEILIGDNAILDSLANRHADMQPHPLQADLERIIEDVLNEQETLVFYMRFGERLPHRTIARQLGYRSQASVQRIIDNMIVKVRDALSAEGHT